jgi:hypothetical protein
MLYKMDDFQARIYVRHSYTKDFFYIPLGPYHTQIVSAPQAYQIP